MSLRPLALAAAALLAAGCGGGGDAAAPPTAVGTTSASGCRAAERPEPREPGTHEVPATLLDPSAEHRLVVETNCGTFTIALDARRSPNATTSLAALARDGYFDGTVFHRIVPGFVIQGGDPTATGTGGPGYTTVDEPAPDTTYRKGLVAMAKAAQEPRGAAGSQFFVVTGDVLQLAPDYAVVGEVTDGLDVVERIGRLGDPATEQPTEVVAIERVSVLGG